MSYYHNIPPTQLAEYRNTFYGLFQHNHMNFDKQVVDDTFIHNIAEYIAYLIYRTHRVKKQFIAYQESKGKPADPDDEIKHVTHFEYYNLYQKTDFALACFIELGWMERIRSTNDRAYRMMQRFIKLDVYP